MYELSYAHAMLLGLVQGITEFLPVSSSGHLAIFQHWLDIDAEAPTMILFDLAVHVGTVIAVITLFFKPIIRFARRLLTELSPGYRNDRLAIRFLLLGVFASVPTALIGLGFKDKLTMAFGRPVWIAIALAATGILLWLSRRAVRPRRGWRRFGWPQALLIGIGQGVAIMPGVSRSGTTISLALLAGLRREWAGQFSFLIAVPAILGATVLQARDLVTSSDTTLASLMTGPLIAGVLVALVTGYVALAGLLHCVRRARLHYFAPYCWMLAAIIWLVLS